MNPRSACRSICRHRRFSGRIKDVGNVVEQIVQAVLAVSDIDPHVIAVENGDYYDNWDSGDEVPIYYWERRKN